jgi:hypothetical protein
MKIETRVKQLLVKIENYQMELKEIQNNLCDHKEATFTYHSNTGNWCPSDNTYWIHVTCPTCRRIWNVYSTETEYRNNKWKELKGEIK